MNVPSFLKLEGESLVFNLDDSEFLFYIPAEFFENTKNSIAIQDGEYVTSIGICCWAIVDKNGKRGKVNLFNFPTMFMCKPYMIENIKGLKLDEQFDEPGNFVVLHFKKGDQVISQVRVPKLITNSEIFFALMVMKAKIPTSISYDDGWKLFAENAKLNGFNYGLSSQLFGILWASICRDRNNVASPFRFAKSDNPHSYKPISIKIVPKFISPYTSIISEGWDESIQSAILMKDKKNLPYSPLEKVLMQ